MQKGHMVKRGDLRSIAGAVSNVGNILPYVSAFIRSFFKVAATGNSEDWVCVKQIQHDARWLLWVLKLAPKRPIPLCVWKYSPAHQLHLPCRAPRWKITTDASPDGMGGVLYGRVVEAQEWKPFLFFRCEVSSVDLSVYANPPARAESKHMPVLELGAILIAVRLWSQRIRHMLQGSTRQCGVLPVVELAIQGDAAAALGVAAKLRSHASAMNCIAREICLEAAIHLVQFGEIAHIPGAANQMADGLSRPGNEKHVAVVDSLKRSGASESVVPLRDESWWRCRADPPEHVLSNPVW